MKIKLHKGARTTLKVREGIRNSSLSFYELSKKYNLSWNTFNRTKTLSGIKKGLKMFFGLLPVVLNVLILVSIFLYLVPQETLNDLLGKNSGIIGIGIAALLGSVALIPMLFTYPLAVLLLKSGLSYQVLAVLITTVLMYGLCLNPVHQSKIFRVKSKHNKKYFKLYWFIDNWFGYRTILIKKIILRIFEGEYLLSILYCRFLLQPAT